MNPRYDLPCLGFGLGLRGPFVGQVIEERPRVGFFEIISENYLETEGQRIQQLEEVADAYPIVMHGVSLSIGSTDPIDIGYLRQLRALADRIGARWISDHVCWTGVAGVNTHDLLPVPLTQSVLAHMTDRLRRVCDFLGRPLFLENPTSYLAYESSSMPEAEFIMRLCDASGCGMLLDVNNVFVNAQNHGFSAADYVDDIDPAYVAQIHLAGHSVEATHILDTHDSPVCDEVWTLYRRYIQRAGATSTLIERDASIPPIDELLTELDLARAHAESTNDAAAA